MRWTVFFVVIGIFASNLARHIWYTHLPPNPRNHFMHYAWDYYMEGTEPRRPGESLLVVVANSQGYGWEVKAGETYAAVAEQRLRERIGNVRIVNWSIPGARYHDIMIAVAEARRLNPTCLIISLSPHSVHQAVPADNRLKTWVTHLYHRLNDPAIRSAIPEPIRSGMTDWRMDAGRWGGRLWPMWRLRSFPSAILANQPALRPFFEQGHAGVWVRFPDARTQPVGPWDDQPWHPVVDVQRAEALLALAADVAPLAIWINMPFRSDLQPAVRTGWSTLASLCITNGVVPIDWSEAFPDALFLSSAHFVQEGHRRYAEKLESLFP
jgi:hypothetical protein